MLEQGFHLPGCEGMETAALPAAPGSQELIFLLQTNSTLQWSEGVLLRMSRHLTKIFFLTFIQPVICLPQAITMFLFKQSLTLQNKFSYFCSLLLILSKLLELQIFLFLFCCLLCKYRGEETGPEERTSHPNGAHCPFIFHC